MLRSALCFLCLVFALFGSTPSVNASLLAPAIPSLVVMDQAWELEVADERRSIQLPYISQEAKEAKLSYRFCGPDSLGTDSLFLWFDGLTWESEYMIGDAYLGMSTQAFGTSFIAIPPQLIRLGEWNELVVILSLGESMTWHPSPFLAMLEAPLLLNRQQLEQAKKQPLKEVSTADTIAIVAPYYRAHAYKFNLFEAVRNLQAVIDANIQYVHFAFPPDRQLQLLCGKLGLIEVTHLEDTSQLCLINAYPFAARDFPTPARFWLDQKANRTNHYGDIWPLNSRSVINPAKVDYPIGLIFMILFPLLSMFLLKLLNPGYFSSQLGFLSNPKMHLSTSLDATGSNTGLLGILMILKGINLSILISLLVYYVLRENEWEQLNIIRDWSLLNVWFYGSKSLWQIFVRSTELSLIWFGLKYLFLVVLGRGFGIKGLVEGIMSIEIAASFPLILFMSLPVGLIQFMDTLWGGWLLSIFLLLALIYLIRRAYIFFLGLQRLFSFSSAVNFLYICALNLIPYLIWF
ncbi:MAG: DUF4271 domain-containing protein [Bacteroidota bacterium]